MRSQEEIYVDVRSTLVEVSGLLPEQISTSARLMEDLGLDSIDAIDMAVHLETRSGFEFKRTELRAVRTVQDVVDLILARQNARAEAVADTVARSE